MSESRLMWYGQPIEDKSREELIEIIRQLSRMNEATAARGVDDLRRFSEIFDNPKAPTTRSASAESLLQPRPTRPGQVEPRTRSFDYGAAFCVIGFFAVLLAVLIIMKSGAN